MVSEYYRVTDRETRLRSVTHSFGLVILAVLLSVVCVFLAAGVVRLSGFTFQSMAALPPAVYAALSAAQFVGFFAAVFAYLRWRDDDTFFAIGLPSLRDVAWIVGGFVGLYGLNLALTVVLQFVGADIATNQVVSDGMQDTVRFLYLIPVTLLFVAPAEELLFRGVIQGLFRRAYGVVPGILLASVMFGFGHWLALTGTGGGKLAYVLVAAVLGIVLGTLYELSGNLTVPIAVHGLYNTLLFVGQYLVATGAVQA